MATKPTRVTNPPWLIPILLGFRRPHAARSPPPWTTRPPRRRPGRVPVDAHPRPGQPVDNLLPSATRCRIMPDLRGAEAEEPFRAGVNGRTDLGPRPMAVARS